jgi:uncharacterized RDD family membrane protein YckC
MNWYYVENGQQAGPVDDAQLMELRRSGRIQADTLVWREGLANWIPYYEAKGEAKPAGASRIAAAARPAAGTAAEGEPVEAVCAECGGIFSKDNMIRYGEVYVCANCKPVFMQKLAEGAKINTGAMNFAGFWIRFGAVFLDGLILKVVGLLISFIAGLSLAQSAGVEPTPLVARQVILLFIQMGIGLAYEVIMIGKYGATLGKMACKIRVITAEGGDVSYLRAFGRYFAKILSGIACAVGYIMAGFDEEKRALHDRICNTRVIYK